MRCKRESGDCIHDARFALRPLIDLGRAQKRFPSTSRSTLRARKENFTIGGEDVTRLIRATKRAIMNDERAASK